MEKPLEQSPLDIAHHADNQRRFLALEVAIGENSRLTEKSAGDVLTLTGDVAALKKDTSELVEMWKDAGVVFKWLRRIGRFLVGAGKLAVLAGAAYAAVKQWWPTR